MRDDSDTSKAFYERRVVPVGCHADCYELWRGDIKVALHYGDQHYAREKMKKSKPKIEMQHWEAKMAIDALIRAKDILERLGEVFADKPLLRGDCQRAGLRLNVEAGRIRNAMREAKRGEKRSVKIKEVENAERIGAEIEHLHREIKAADEKAGR